MIFTGTARTVGANIDTDAIIPARFLVTTDPAELGASCMEGLTPGWVKRVKPGDILVAGPNFGCGSSREHAPLAILGAGIPVVVAHSYARIFYRNCINKGLPLVESVQPGADGTFQLVVREGERATPVLLDFLSSRGVRVDSVALKRPTLDDVFLRYTGRQLREEEGAAGYHRMMRAVRRGRR